MSNMTVFPDNNSEYRYERKYVTGALSTQAVESIIKTHPADFSEIFHRRYVNNIYFDTFGLKSYFDRIDGASSSIKARIRWYGQLFGDIPNPMLELKIKRGPLGKKQIFSLGSFLLDEKFSLDAFMNLLRDSKVPDVVKACLAGMEFSILNRFSRKYFLSADKKFRLTVDSGIKYYEMNNHHNIFLNTASEHDVTVIEIKYDRNDDDLAPGITNFLTFRMSRNSKYVNALERLNLW